jgi:hypothetical protein
MSGRGEVSRRDEEPAIQTRRKVQRDTRTHMPCLRNSLRRCASTFSRASCTSNPIIFPSTPGPFQSLLPSYSLQKASSYTLRIIRIQKPYMGMRFFIRDLFDFSIVFMYSKLSDLPLQLERCVYWVCFPVHSCMRYSMSRGSDTVREAIRVVGYR